MTDRLNVIATLPYVWTNASQGVLHGMSGFQDLTVAAKYGLLERRSRAAGRCARSPSPSAGVPASDYTPDL